MGFRSASLLLLAAFVAADPVYVQVQKTSFLGVHSEALGIDSFRGVYYAHSERWKKPILADYGTDQKTVNASFFGVACPQIKGTNALATDYGIYGTDEDCNLLDIYRPHGIDSNAKLPVIVWLHGGALTQGAASHYPADMMVAQSVYINRPVIVISINYRLALWGFLGGSSPSRRGALNLGLYDQRAALEWVQRYIGYFGGDPAKVTVFGQSSGAMSIAYHYLNENTQLFRAAIFESGAPTSVPVLKPENYDNVYKALVDLTGCSSNDESRTFECLRKVDNADLTKYVNVIFGKSELYSGRPWGIAIDGDVIPDSPSKLVAQGKIARLPFLTGNVHDEGTAFVKPQTISSSADFITFAGRDYVGRNPTFLSNQTTVNKLQELYPADPALGSPFGTGKQTFGLGTQFKRSAAMYGDLHFQAPRRLFLELAHQKGIPAWSYDFDQFNPPSNASAWMGVYHTSEIPYVFMTVSGSEQVELAKKVHEYWVTFATHLDPSPASLSSWNPTWKPYGSATAAERNTLHIEIGNTTMIKDDFRLEQTEWLTSVADQFLEAPY